MTAIDHERDTLRMIEQLSRDGGAVDPDHRALAARTAFVDRERD